MSLLNCLVLMSIIYTRTSQADHNDVCIIGSGISGSSVSLFLKEELSRFSIISKTIVFESELTTGGRLHSIELETDYGLKRFEQGASIFHGTNLYFKSFVDFLKLKISKPSRVNNILGIFNGKTVLYKSNRSSLLTLLSMIWRYGYKEIQLVRREIKKIADKFAKFYEVQALSDITQFLNRSCISSGNLSPETCVPVDAVISDSIQHLEGFATVQELLESVGLYEYTQMTIFEYLTEIVKLPADSRFLNEILAAAIRVNYNQGLSVNALAGAVGIIPVVAPDLFAVEVGNGEVPRHLIELFADDLRLGHRVTEITAVTIDDTNILRISGTYSDKRDDIHDEANDVGDRVEEPAGPSTTQKTFSIDCDAVILATPLETSGIRLTNMDVNASESAASEPYRREYQHTHTTFVNGVINMTHFGLHPARDVFPATFLTTNHCAEFTSIGTYFTDESSGMSIYKIFSRTALDSSVLNSMFSNITGVWRRDWEAYTKFNAPERFLPFQIRPNVFYIHAFENAVSCAECLIVAARNVAALVAKAFKQG